MVTKVIGIGMIVEYRIPKGSTVCFVVQQSPGKDIRMLPGSGIHGVSSIG